MPEIKLTRYENGELVSERTYDVTEEHAKKVSTFFARLSAKKRKFEQDLEKRMDEKYPDRFKKPS